MAKTLKDQIRELLKVSGLGISEDIKSELRLQGHVNTGELIKSVQSGVINQTDGVDLEIEMNDYHVFVEHGVKAGRIPFGGRSKGGRGQTSKYIEGLIKFWTAKGKSKEEAKRAAFATAHKQKSEGMPTRQSYEHSKNGRRTQFLNESTKSTRQINELENNLIDQVDFEAQKILNTWDLK